MPLQYKKDPSRKLKDTYKQNSFGITYKNFEKISKRIQRFRKGLQTITIRQEGLHIMQRDNKVSITSRKLTKVERFTTAHKGLQQLQFLKRPKRTTMHHKYVQGVRGLKNTIQMI